MPDTNMPQQSEYIEIEEVLHYIIVRPQPFTDMKIVNAFRESLNYVSTYCKFDILLDFRSIVHLYSSVIGILIHCSQSIQSQNRKCIIVNASQSLRKLLNAMNIGSVIPIFDSIESVLHSNTPEPDEPFLSQYYANISNTPEQTIIKIENTQTKKNSFPLELHKILRYLNSRKIILDLNSVSKPSSHVVSFMTELADWLSNRHNILTVLNAHPIIKQLPKSVGLEHSVVFHDVPQTS